ncbi:MAG: hypothetical protein KDI36_09085 [Pseudomonadales bacterium]|nr:hypothetical protein [Pseudomonadales bacterium]
MLPRFTLMNTLMVLVFLLGLSPGSHGAGFGNTQPVGGSGKTQAAGGFGNAVSTWDNIYGQGGYTHVESLIVSRTGGYVTAGAVGRGAALQMAGVADKQIQVTRIDTGGSYVWVKSYTPFGVKLRGEARRLAEDADGNIFIAGDLGEHGNKSRPETRDVFVMKVSPQGEQIWARKYGGPEANIVYALAIANDGGVLLLGNKGQGKERQTWLFKLNAEGEFLGESLFPEYHVANVLQVQDDGMLLAGVGLLKVDHNGNEVARYDNFPGSVAHMLPVEGGYLIAGSATRGDRYPAWVGKTDPQGKLIWSKTYDFKKQKLAAVSAVASDDTGIYLAGSQKLTFGDHSVAFVMKTDLEGNPLWKKLLSGTKLGARFTEIVSTADGGLLAGGITDEDFTMNNGNARFFGKALLIKFDREGQSILLKDENLKQVKIWN